jgi:hypothetical protein
MTTVKVGTAGPRNAVSDPYSGLRYYTWQGRKLLSATSIPRALGIAHGLHTWMIGLVVDRAMVEYAELGRRMAEDPSAARRWLRSAPEEISDRAAKKGTLVHLAAEQGLRPEDVDEATAPKLRQYHAWMDDTGFEVLGQELQVWNLELGYAGSLDILGRRPDGSLAIVDIKTGKSVKGRHGELYPEIVIQQVAYLMAEFVGADDVVDEPTTELLHQVEHLSVLHLADDGWEEIPVVVAPAEWDAFRGIVAFSSWVLRRGVAA